DRLAYGCKGLSPNGVSVLLHQTLIQGSAARARGPRRLWDCQPTPKKLLRTPTPALQNGGQPALDDHEPGRGPLDDLHPDDDRGIVLGVLGPVAAEYDGEGV